MIRKLITVSHILCAFSNRTNLPFAHKYRLVSPLSTAKMSSVSLQSIPKVDIDPSGVFKYILIKVHDPTKDNDDDSVTVVRGYKRCNYHADIFDEVQPQFEPFEGEPLGGGRISHDPEAKKIHIYGYSQGYGKADHECTAQLVKEAYPSYKISISDEGY